MASRIGNKPVEFPADVKVSAANGVVTVEGKKGKLSYAYPKCVGITVEGNLVHVKCEDEEAENASAFHGLARSLVHNMVVGVTQGYRKELQIVGVGYKAALAGKKLTLNLGYSHAIDYMIPEGAKVTVADGVKITIEGIDKQLVGEVAARIRRFKQPEPYKGKGVRYADENVVIKPGKTNA